MLEEFVCMLSNCTKMCDGQDESIHISKLNLNMLDDKSITIGAMVI